MIHGSSTSPIAFQWDAWYASVGGRTIQIAEVDEYLQQIRDYQYPRFTGEVNTEKTTFINEQEASLYIKNKARTLGADEVGIALIEPSDVYKDATPVGHGYNLKTGEMGDLIEMGVIDPLKVTRSALQNAVSVAVTILSTNAIITMARTYEQQQ